MSDRSVGVDLWDPPPLDCSEDAFQALVIDYARLHGWLVHHTRPARTAQGWRTSLQGDAGFSDLVMARGGRVVFAELKAAKGRLTAEQQRWQEAFPRPVFVEECDLGRGFFLGRALGSGIAAPCVSYLWRPADWEELVEVLR